ncbi:HNH endonuclease [Desulfotalea psychrophila]|uniref:Probable HNH endonuclease family protein n=1 Tax=Desulfotalea psychrophila (strain LSv54 / DSM 12343) TaxID=177439 RepID=Q6AJ74_DESPS|nr:HNH endonuclease [Desulfotalea psychrophila]CAG37606.1 probable HNH endonuclease family protein [Desulfotalea psychrophila LSv54]
MIENFDFDAVDEATIRRERAKARDLRKTRWWQQKTSSGLCYYCSKKVLYKDVTMDHLVPLARGGRSSKDNLVPCCKDCNNKKKNMLPLEWEAYQEGLAEKK